MNPSATTQQTKMFKVKPRGRADGETAAGHCSLLTPVGGGGRAPTACHADHRLDPYGHQDFMYIPTSFYSSGICLLAAKTVKPPDPVWFQFIALPRTALLVITLTMFAFLKMSPY